jgi:hypothetical protein
MAQAIGRPLGTTEVWVPFQAFLSGTFGEQSGTGTAFSPSSLVGFRLLLSFHQFSIVYVFDLPPTLHNLSVVKWTLFPPHTCLSNGTGPSQRLIVMKETSLSRVRTRGLCVLSAQESPHGDSGLSLIQNPKLNVTFKSADIEVRTRCHFQFFFKLKLAWWPLQHVFPFRLFTEVTAIPTYVP